MKIQSVPRNMKVARQIDWRLWSLKRFAAFIRKPNFRSKILELIIIKHPVF